MKRQSSAVLWGIAPISLCARVTAIFIPAIFTARMNTCWATFSKLISRRWSAAKSIPRNQDLIKNIPCGCFFIHIYTKNSVGRRGFRNQIIPVAVYIFAHFLKHRHVQHHNPKNKNQKKQHSKNFHCVATANCTDL